MALTILKKNLYALTDGDKAIINSAIRNKNPNIITNYYLRNEDSGTYWRYVPQATIDKFKMKQSKQVALAWREGYDKLENMWNSLSKPDYFGPDPANPAKWVAWNKREYERLFEDLSLVYRLQWDTENDKPEFHHPHGTQFLPWAHDMYHNKSPLQVVIGGFGSGKTQAKVMSFLVRGIMLRGYRAFALAPQSKQSDEVHKVATQMIEGTRFEKFVYGMPFRPNPAIQMGHDGVGRTSIECFPMIDDPKKIRTLTGDEAMVDQAEEFPDLSEVVRSVGTRFRGQVRGRPRRGQLAFIANAGDNPQLWDYFDDAKEDSDIWASSPATFDNPFLTLADLGRYENQVGDESDQEVYMLGKRPLGAGEHFSLETLTITKSKDLDRQMDEALIKKEPGWVVKTAKKVGQHTWERPPQKDRVYCVACDPGYGNPPDRNSAVIGVFDVTDFPSRPAELAAFSWVYGNNSPNPWIAKYHEYVVKYEALALNGYDATGPSGAGYDRLDEIKDLMATGVGLQANKKFKNFNLLKKIMADGKIRMPTIEHAFSQLSKYRLPDDKLRQDIVSMLIIFAALVEPMMLNALTPDEVPEESFEDAQDRWSRPFEGVERYYERTDR